MIKIKYKLHNMQCKQGFTVQLTIINSEHERKEKTRLKLVIYSILIVCKRVLYECKTSAPLRCRGV